MVVLSRGLRSWMLATSTCIWASFAPVALAQEPDPDVPAHEHHEAEAESVEDPGKEASPVAPDPVLRTTSVTLSMTAILSDVGELAWEQRLPYGLSGVVIGGIGHGPFSDDGTESRTMFEVGCQLRYTIAGHFDDGLGIAVDGRYLHVGAEEAGTRSHGFALGPRLFWKWVFFHGLTLDINLGASWVWAGLINARGEPILYRDGLQSTGTLNLGWSFGK